MIDLRKISRQMRFSGVVRVEPLADRQKGPTCGFEALENIIQLFGRGGNDLAAGPLLVQAQRHGALLQAEGGYAADIRGYQAILWDYGISARWYPADFQQVVVPALLANRGVLVVGDAYYLNPGVYRHTSSNHAWILTNFYTDEGGLYVLGFLGVDSNFEGSEQNWPLQSIELALQWAVANVTRTPVLITDTAITWPSTASHYRLMRNGMLIPVP